MKLFQYIALFFLICLSPLRGDSVVSVERAALHHIVVGMNVFKSINNGNPPQNWKEIGTVVQLGPNNEGLIRKQGYRLEDRYELLEHPIPYLGEEGGKIIMIRTVPLEGKIGNIDGLYRYAIIESKSGQVKDIYESEGRLKAAFKAANTELPNDADSFATETENPAGTPQTPESPVIPQTTTPPQATVMQPSISKPVASPTPTGVEEKLHAEPSFPMLPVAIIVAAIVGIGILILRRKST